MRLVIASVNYADMLAIALPAWTTIVPRGTLTVATSPEDTESQRVAAACGVRAFVTDAWTRLDPSCHYGGTPTFNLALALDEALGILDGPPNGEILGHVSADCYPFGRWPDDATFDADTVYGFWRYECLSPKALTQHVAGTRPRSAFPKLKNSHGWPIGYCQIFRWAEGRRFRSYATAGKFDTHFSERFAKRQMRDELYFLHLGPSSVRENWAGRVIPRWGAA